MQPADSKADADADELTLDNVDDLRIRAIRPLVPSACLMEDVGSGLDDADVYDLIQKTRKSLTHATRGDDGRLVVVVGPASAHDPEAVMEYARRLKEASEPLQDELIVVMRVFLDEPSGGAGSWSGAMYDPAIDGSFQINKGFRDARKLLLAINRLGLPAGCLYNDTISPQFVADLVSWACISSRTTSSTLHRELASGLSTPVGFQAAGAGPTAAELAVDAVHMSARAHTFLSVSKQGVAGIVETTGNCDCHIVLPPGAESIARACAKLEHLECPARVMINCTDAASISQVALQVSSGSRQVLGVLVPSFLKAGAQPLLASGAKRIYGQSVTEPCISWEATATYLAALASAVKERRARTMPTPRHEDSVRDFTAFLEHGRLEGQHVDNLRVRRIRPLIPAAVCIEELEAERAVRQLVFQTRCEISGLLHGKGEKLVIIAGPPVIHDSKAAMEYAARLKTLAAELADELLVVMAVNFEDSSTVPTGGWKGLINDPRLDGSLQINSGIRTARELLLSINRLGLPAGCEYLDTITPQFIADLISWAQVGARTCASRSHRELASGLSTPVGFHKGCGGDGHDGRVAVDAVRASSAAHAFLSVSKQGVAGIVETTGNCDCHIVLPPSKLEPAIDGECGALRGLGLPTKSTASAHGATQDEQQAVVKQVAELDLHAEQGTLAHGMSVTEPCMDWAATAEAMRALAAAVRHRRGAGSAKRMRVA